MRRVSVTSFVLTGSGCPDQYVHEGTDRVALWSDDEGCWRLFGKQRKAREKPIGDWEYEWLSYKGTLFRDQEPEVIKWVLQGGRVPAARGSVLVCAVGMRPALFLS